jgi:DNA-binding response OmpR family regulator
MAQNSIPLPAATGDFEKGPPTAAPVSSHEGATGDWINADELALSPGLRKARYRDNELTLTSAEFNILEHLLRHRGRVVSRDDLVPAALGRRLGTLDRSIDVHISRLRKKIVQCGGDGDRIKTVRGSGYVYTAFRTEV